MQRIGVELEVEVLAHLLDALVDVVAVFVAHGFALRIDFKVVHEHADFAAAQERVAIVSDGYVEQRPAARRHKRQRAAGCHDGCALQVGHRGVPQVRGAVERHLVALVVYCPLARVDKLGAEELEGSVTVERGHDFQRIDGMRHVGCNERIGEVQASIGVRPHTTSPDLVERLVLTGHRFVAIHVVDVLVAAGAPFWPEDEGAGTVERETREIEIVGADGFELQDVEAGFRPVHPRSLLQNPLAAIPFGMVYCALLVFFGLAVFLCCKRGEEAVLLRPWNKGKRAVDHGAPRHAGERVGRGIEGEQ